MKDKILVLIIGILIGAIVTASGFLIYEKVNTNSKHQMLRGEGMQMMGRPDGEEPPEKPEGESQQNSSSKSTPPEKPSDSGNNEKSGNKSESQQKSNSSTNEKTTN